MRTVDVGETNAGSGHVKCPHCNLWHKIERRSNYRHKCRICAQEYNVEFDKRDSTSGMDKVERGRR